MSLPALLPGQRVDPSVSRRAIEARKHESRVDRRIVELQAKARAERKTRVEAERNAVDAERNATHFHALLIAERIRRLPTQTNGTRRSTYPGSAAGATGGDCTS